MPVKRRRPKRRADPETEMMLWAELFETGQEGFAGDLEELGFHSILQARAAAPDAWARLGGLFLATQHPEGPVWALEQFGAPQCQ